MSTSKWLVAAILPCRNRWRASRQSMKATSQKGEEMEHGEYIDLVMMGLLREEWLNSKVR
jgi:hypothetical protein